MPDLLFRLNARQSTSFQGVRGGDRADRIYARQSIWLWQHAADRLFVALAEGRVAPPRNLDLATIQQQELANTFRFHISQYLMRRVADWKTAGFLSRYPTGRRSMPARNFGEMISAPRSRTGKRLATLAIRSAAAKASMSGLCCANYCGEPI